MTEHKENAPSFRNAKAGDIITFGIYPQLADGTDRTPISWRVLQNSGGELLILSEYILDCKRYHNDDKPYHSEDADITWHDCDLRKWLNDEFYNAAFDDDEKGIIKTAFCGGNGEGCPDTEDKVFLLSVDEVKTFTDATDETAARRRAVGTDFAKIKKADGYRLYVYDKSIEKDYIIENGKKLGCSWWWTRTRGNHPSRAVFIGARSNIKRYGRVNLGGLGVRPALRIMTM
ncbi:MAG: DUF6273 domain-containing protein [Candidatus Paceibacterota bacterium]|jgi:hypothetical protein|nr:DUF6273 domain-containing protein [Candidatus Paceibacterota bacterium]